jgi:tRNA dimethylallyltransferase
VVCGGTGLYLDALLRKNDFAPDTSDAAVRRELEEFYEANGAVSLHELLRAIDPESAAATLAPLTPARKQGI